MVCKINPLKKINYEFLNYKYELKNMGELLLGGGIERDSSFSNAMNCTNTLH